MKLLTAFVCASVFFDLACGSNDAAPYTSKFRYRQVQRFSIFSEKIYVTQPVHFWYRTNRVEKSLLVIKSDSKWKSNFVWVDRWFPRNFGDAQLCKQRWRWLSRNFDVLANSDGAALRCPHSSCSDRSCDRHPDNLLDDEGVPAV